ncbi:BC85_0335 family putative methyltransferase [Mycoplasma phocimorsus]|uniref:BC85_0335 family putative methyltransferase n=1 Tax=Mycoplasma phocimorsus TaxID=3045839 RepID=UPI0024BF586C|nr:hypothetical protein [Mycoplasma phocimorsus]MDJ1646874.1 hypothetical protein [Mycoplasma phocimorsus]
MKLNLINNFWTTSKIILGISAIVAILISLVTSIVFIIVKNNIVKKSGAGSIPFIVRPNKGEISSDVMKLLKYKINEKDVDFLLDCIYVNSYQNILISKNHEYIAYAIQKQIQFANIFQKEINQQNFKILQDHDLTYNVNKMQVETYDLIYISFEELNFNSMQENLKQLNDRGMIIVNIESMDKFSKTALIYTIEKFNIKYEYSLYKNLLLIVKNNL